MLMIYDSLRGEKREFVPVTPGEIKIYSCGNTVYDYCHIGHARSEIVFDVIVKYLRSVGWKVTFVRNITDIDDKIIARANENQETCDELTNRMIAIMHEDEKALGLDSPDVEPRATQYIPQIIALIEKLIANGNAYVADNGDVYFEVRQFEQYGKLSHRDVDQLCVGARIQMGEQKKDPLDFVLWKSSKPGEPTWDSPWGAGRPGWHIECSAMSTDILGQPFDIHGGGMDLKFPHHENEIAQSEAACGHGFANTWMHVGLLNVNGEKMSKSLNNFFTIRDVLAEYHPELVRYFMVTAHYRSPVNFSKENLSQCQHALMRLYTALRDVPEVPADAGAFAQSFHEAMQDDFNTSEALAVLFEMAKQINRLKKQGELQQAGALASALKAFGFVLGILQQDPNHFLQGDSNQDASKIEALIAARNQAREDKNWQQADQIRDQLAAMNIEIEDGPQGTRWRRAQEL